MNHITTENHCYLLNFNRDKTQQMQNSTIYVSITMHIMNNLMELFIADSVSFSWNSSYQIFCSQLIKFILFISYKINTKVNLHTEIRSRA
jgi:hypothetical protein